MVAFENFDLLVSSPNGKDTMHETVEIGIQTIPSQEEETDKPLIVEEFEEPNSSSQRKRRRITFAAKNNELAPYPKKLSMSTTLLDVNDERRKLNVANITSVALLMDLVANLRILRNSTNTNVGRLELRSRKSYIYRK